MYQRLLIPTDGSDTAAAAGKAAVALAAEHDATLHAIYVHELASLPYDFDEVPEEYRSRTHEAVEEIEAQAKTAGVDVETAVLENDGPVHTAIIDYATEHEIDCVVMGTHGRTGVGRFVLGSVTERTLRESPIPVMGIHGDTVFQPAFESILVPTDSSDGAWAALHHATDLALATDASMYLVHAIDLGGVTGDPGSGYFLDRLEKVGQDMLDKAAIHARQAGISNVQTTLLRGSPQRVIREYAKDKDLDAIVMGTHGRTGVQRWFLGSVTERVVRRSEVPVIAVSSRGPEEDEEEAEE